jgi:hypothetical protein
MSGPVDFSDPNHLVRRRRLAQFEQLWYRQRGRCYFCWVEMLDPRFVPVKRYRRKPGRMATDEHLTPRSRGGKRTPDNIRLACNTCNQRKGNRTEAEFLAEDAERLRRLRRLHCPDIDNARVEQPGSSPVS